MTMSGASTKTLQDQIRELQKLVLDAQDQLDLAVRGLGLLEDQLKTFAASANAANLASHD
jgi:hypothetical protein